MSLAPGPSEERAPLSRAARGGRASEEWSGRVVFMSCSILTFSDSTQKAESCVPSPFSTNQRTESLKKKKKVCFKHLELLLPIFRMSTNVNNSINVFLSCSHSEQFELESSYRWQRNEAQSLKYLLPDPL